MRTMILFLTFSALIWIESGFSQITREQAAQNAFDFTEEYWFPNDNHVNQWESNGCGANINAHNFWLGQSIIKGLPYGFGGKDDISLFNDKMNEGNSTPLGGISSWQASGTIIAYGTLVSSSEY